MLLKAGNAPRNELLDDGFDLQYIARKDKQPQGVPTCIHVADRYVVLPILWPYRKNTCRFGSGEVTIMILQSKTLVPATEIGEHVTILKPTDRLLGIRLMEDTVAGMSTAKLCITYGSSHEDALSEEHALAIAQEGYLH